MVVGYCSKMLRSPQCISQILMAFWTCTLPKGSISRLILSSGLAWGLKFLMSQVDLACRTKVGRLSVYECWGTKTTHVQLKSQHDLYFVYIIYLFSCCFVVFGLFYSPIIAKLFQRLTNDCFENILYFHAVVLVEVLHLVPFYLLIYSKPVSYFTFL